MLASDLEISIAKEAEKQESMGVKGSLNNTSGICTRTTKSLLLFWKTPLPGVERTLDQRDLVTVDYV